MVPLLFKTFHWLLISFRIKFKFPLEATRLYMIRPFLWLQITLLLTHPMPATLGSLLFLKYTKHALASRLCICCFLPDIQHWLPPPLLLSLCLCCLLREAFIDILHKLMFILTNFWLLYSIALFTTWQLIIFCVLQLDCKLHEDSNFECFT